LLCRLGSTIAQRQVVFGGAAFVGMTLDHDAELRVVPQEVRRTGKCGTRIGADVCPVVIEKRIHHFPCP
jgi:hypothetical protein